jgi:hypothetical protein
MEKTSFSHHVSLPNDSAKRVAMVIAACIETGYINRVVLANYYGLTQLQASILLREFLQAHAQDVRREPKHNGYLLRGYPKKFISNKHLETHCG